MGSGLPRDMKKNTFRGSKFQVSGVRCQESIGKIAEDR
jgi:hypothetical protein